MTEAAGIVRVPHSDSAGTGLTEWEAMDPDSLVSGTPVQRGWLADETAATGYLAGVWDCTAFVDQPGQYGVDEFMILLEGRVILRMPDGAEVTVTAGEAFVIPKGLQCQWVMPDYVRKVFMIVDDPAPEGAANPSLARVTVPDLAPAGGDGPVETAYTWFVSASGRMRVDFRIHRGGQAAPAALAEHELLHVLEGALTLSAGTATAHFGPGETAYVSAGTTLAREHAPGTRILASTYRPR